MDEKIKIRRQPITMTFSIADINDAIEYWLTNAILRKEVKVENVTFSGETHFTVLINRSDNAK